MFPPIETRSNMQQEKSSCREANEQIDGCMSNYIYFGSSMFYFYFFSPVSTFTPLCFSLDCYISRTCTFLCHLCRYVAQEGVEAFCSQGQYKMMPFRVRGRKWQSGWGGGQGWGWSLQSDAAGMAVQGHEDVLRPRH